MHSNKHLLQHCRKHQIGYFASLYASCRVFNFYSFHLKKLHQSFLCVFVCLFFVQAQVDLANIYCRAIDNKTTSNRIFCIICMLHVAYVTFIHFILKSIAQVICAYFFWGGGGLYGQVENLVMGKRAKRKKHLCIEH